MGKFATSVRSGAKLPRGWGSFGGGRRRPRDCSRSCRPDLGAPGRNRERTRGPESAAQQARVKPRSWRQAASLLGTSRRAAPLCSREGEAGLLLQGQQGNPRPGVLGAKSALLLRGGSRRLLTAAAGCVRCPGRGWGAQGGGLGARPVAGPAVLGFPAWLRGPPRGCSVVLLSAAQTSRPRQTFRPLHVELLLWGS